MPKYIIYMTVQKHNTLAAKNTVLFEGASVSPEISEQEYDSVKLTEIFYNQISRPPSDFGFAKSVISKFV